MQAGKLWSPYFDVAITLFRYNFSCGFVMYPNTPGPHPNLTIYNTVWHIQNTAKLQGFRFVYLVLHISVAYTVIWQVRITASDSTQGTESQWHTHIIYNVDVSLTDAEIQVPCAE